MTRIDLTPEPTVPSPDNAADKARGVIVAWLGEGLNRDPKWIKVNQDNADKLLAALDRAGLVIVSKEE